MTKEAAEDAESYDREYFEGGRLGAPYRRGEEEWEAFFGRVADAIVASVDPKTVLDVGCAIGFLVEALRARGVDAHGIDVSEYAVSQVPPALAPFVRLGSVTEELEGSYDLIVCIEVLEHLPESEAERAVANLARHGEAVLFSSTPSHFAEETHLNVQPPAYWAELFARNGFFREGDLDPEVVAPQAMFFRRADSPAAAIGYYEQRQWSTRSLLRGQQEEIRALSRRAAALETRADTTAAALAAAETRLAETTAHLTGRLSAAEDRLNRRLTLPGLPSRAVTTGHAAHARILVRRSLETLRHEGPVGFARRTGRWVRARRLERVGTDVPTQGAYSREIERRYVRWRRKHDPSPAKLIEQRTSARALASGPLISIVVPMFDPPLRAARSMLESVLAQTYDRWELCVANAGQDPQVVALLEELGSRDERIKVVQLEANGGISANSNAALELATGEFVALLDHDDDLAPEALFAVAEAIVANPEADLLYSDEDRLMPDGRRVLPFLKPDWSPELLHSFMYVGHLGVYRRSLVEEVGRFRSEFDGSQDYDLALRVSARARRVVHIPQVLYHWRMVPGSAAGGGKGEARRTNLAALADAIDEQGHPAGIAEYPFANRVCFEIPGDPKVSIIIPTDDLANALECVRGLDVSTYENREVLVVTNAGVGERLQAQVGPGVRIVRFDGPFNFSAKCNEGAAAADGEYLVFLNDDVVPLTPDWIESLLQYAQLPDVGGVSPKLLYADQTIQYAGLVTGVRDVVGTAFHTWPRWDGSYSSLAICVRNVSCLSGACMMVRAATLDEAGGWDEVNVPISHSDFDLSFRLEDLGLRLVYTPFAELRHLGGRSRRAAGVDPDEAVTRADGGADLYMLARWGERMARDPFYPSGMRALLYEDTSDFELRAPAPAGVPERWWEQPRVLLVSHDLSSTGAPLMLLEVAKALAAADMFAAVAAPASGLLADDVLEAGIPLVLDEMILSDPARADRFLGQFDLICAGTVHGWRVVERAHALGKRAIWFVQESAFGVRLARELGAVGAFAKADRIVFPSEHAARVFDELGVGRRAVIRYGIPDPAESSPVDVPEADDARVRVVWTGSIEPRKAPDVLVEAVRRLPPDVRSRLDVVLGGAVLVPEYAERLRRAARDLPVRFLGERRREEILGHVASADIFVCTSRDESGPVVVLEAMALGKATISTPTGFVPEVLEDGVDAVFVPYDDAGALARELEALVIDEERRERLGAAARRTYEDGYRATRYAEDVVGLARELLPSGRAVEAA